jgi:DNA primase
VYPSAVHCFACGYHADIFAVWQQLRQVDFHTAWTDLLALAQQQDSVPVAEFAQDAVMRNGQDFVPLYDQVLDCCEALVDTRGAAYLTGRGIDPAAAAELGVRWAGNPALGRIQHLLAQHDTVAEEAGLADRNGRFTLRCHRLLFPSHRDGQVVWMQGRSTRADVAKLWRWRSLTGITPWPTGLSLLDSQPTEEPVYVIEGPTDWLALASRGRVVIGVCPEHRP